MEPQQQRSLCGVTPGRAARCGAGVSSGPAAMRLSITSTSGSPVEVAVPRGETVEGLRAHLSQTLRLGTNKMVLLHREKQLTAGRLTDLGVEDQSSLTLVPVIEAGLLCSTARAVGNLKDVLESLTEAQISDFLSGRSPLTVNLGIGVHVMRVHLQLSPQNVAELQQRGGLRPCSSSGMQTAPPPAARTRPPDRIQTSTTGPAASPASRTAAPAPGSPGSTSSRPRAPLKSTGPTSPSSSRTPVVTCSSPCQSCPPDFTHTHQGSSRPHPNCSLKAATPVCSPAPTGSRPEPCSPAPASTFKESDVGASSSAELSKQPGAVIESFGSHAPGVFSGTFSGSLAPCSQSHPPSAIFLQILSDLLRAAFHHQGASQALSPLFWPPADPSASPLLTAEQQKGPTLMSRRAEQVTNTPGEVSRPIHSSTQENQALHSKLEHLQLLIHQRGLRRRTRRNSQLSQTSYPYEQHHHHP